MKSDLSQLLHDPARLAALHNLGLLGTPPDPAFDRLTHVAALTVQVPMALVVLLDADRQFFESAVGLPEPWASRRETPLSHSFCQHTLGSSDPLIVEDARHEPALISNLAISDLGVIAYLGIPLRTKDGYPIGSFCVIDSRPRAWTPREVHILQELASLAMAEIEGRRERRERERVEAMVQHAQEELEQRVQARTMELATVNTALHAEITERKRIEAALRASEERYRKLVETSPDAIILMDLDTTIRFYNKQAARLLGYECQESILGQRGFTFLAAGDQQRARANLQQRLSQGKISDSEYTLLKRDGGQVPVELNASVVETEGRPTALICVLRDITERKQAEQALRVSELRYRMLIEQSPLSIQIVAPDGRVLQVNHAWEELWGVTLDQIPEYNLLHDAQLEAKGVMPYIRRAFAGEAVETLPVLYDPETTLPERTRNVDPQRWVQTIIYPVKAWDGTVREIVLIQRDITEQKWAEDALRVLADASRILAPSLDYETTLSSVTNLLVPAIADSCMLYISEEDGQDRQIAAANANPVTEALINELARVYRLDQDNPEDLIIQSLRTGKSVLVTEPSDALVTSAIRDARVRRIYQKLNPASFMIVPLVAHGRVLGTIACATLASGRRYGQADLALVEDLARRAAIAVENARLYRNAQHALKMRDEFLSIAAHELKTPLTTLLGHTQSLQRRMARSQILNERDQRVLHILGEQVLRLDRQIETLLDVTRIELGQFQLECHPVDLCTLAQRVVAELATTTEHHPMSLYCAEETLIVQGDELRLAEVLQNLLQNAIKYSPMGGPITVRIERRGGQASMAITDKGIGIPEAARPHLFERFYRASNTSDQSIKGTGIGLYLVNEIVTRHGGMVDVDSTEGTGSTFTVYLPLLEGE